MKWKLRELKDIDDVLDVYDIYKYCMYMPTKEKYEKKIISYMQNESIRIYVCIYHESIRGIIIISFYEHNKAEIEGISVDECVRGQGVGSYMIQEIKENFDLNLLSAETDDDAVIFYKKNGFKITEFTSDFDGNRVTRYKCEL